MTITEALRRMAEALEEADVEDARREARLLLLQALDLDLAGLITHENRPLGGAAARAETLLARRCRHEPLSRILGWREFFGLDFALNAATLDPRPDTETLVEVVLNHCAQRGTTEGGLEILDIGTGTGAILIALLSRLPGARGLGVDLSPDAVRMAQQNAGALGEKLGGGLAGRARFCVGDVMEGLAGPFDIIVSNPPYIPAGEIDRLEPEVRLHDPRLALDGGPDGLDFYRKITRDAASRLVPGGFLALEVGFGQAQAVAAMMRDASYLDIQIARDLGGIERVVSGVAPG